MVSEVLCELSVHFVVCVTIRGAGRCSCTQSVLLFLKAAVPVMGSMMG